MEYKLSLLIYTPYTLYKYFYCVAESFFEVPNSMNFVNFSLLKCLKNKQK